MRKEINIDAEATYDRLLELQSQLANLAVFLEKVMKLIQEDW